MKLKDALAQYPGNTGGKREKGKITDRSYKPTGRNRPTTRELIQLKRIYGNN